MALFIPLFVFYNPMNELSHLNGLILCLEQWRSVLCLLCTNPMLFDSWCKSIQRDPTRASSSTCCWWFGLSKVCLCLMWQLAFRLF